MTEICARCAGELLKIKDPVVGWNGTWLCQRCGNTAYSVILFDSPYVRIANDFLEDLKSKGLSPEQIHRIAHKFSWMVEKHCQKEARKEAEREIVEEANGKLMRLRRAVPIRSEGDQ